MGSKKILVAISGKIGSGKTTLCKSIIKHTNACKVSFADVLKIECAELYNFDKELGYTDIGKNTMVDIPKDMQHIMHKDKDLVRHILQKHAEYRRKTDLGYFVNPAKKMVRNFFDNGYDIVVIDDLRYQNEANALLDMSNENVIVLLVRLNPYHGWLEPQVDMQHISEIDLDNYQKFNFWVTPGKDQSDLVGKMIGTYIRQEVA